MKTPTLTLILLEWKKLWTNLLFERRILIRENDRSLRRLEILRKLLIWGSIITKRNMLRISINYFISDRQLLKGRRYLLENHLLIRIYRSWPKLKGIHQLLFSLLSFCSNFQPERAFQGCPKPSQLHLLLLQDLKKHLLLELEKLSEDDLNTWSKSNLMMKQNRSKFNNLLRRILKLRVRSKKRGLNSWRNIRS